MRKPSLLLAALTMLACVLPAFPQDPTVTSPPKVLQIVREEVKPGKAPAHINHEANWTQAMLRAKFTTPQLAATTVSGPNEAWFFTGYDSFAAWEKDQKALNAAPLAGVMAQYMGAESDYLSNSRTLVARYREDLSYRPDIKLGEMRYFNVRTVRVRTGHDEEYGAIRKLINAAREKSNSILTRRSTKSFPAA